MKKINILLIVIMALIGFSSCEDDPIGPVISVGASPVLSISSGTSSFVLTEATENDTMTIFLWTEADFGFSAGVTYMVQMDETGNDFTDLMSLNVTNKLASSVTVGFVNNLLLSSGYPFGVESDFDLRVMATLHEDVDTLYSESLAISITPFEKIVIYPMLYLPGGYQGWAPDVAPNLYSLKSNNKYEGYVYMPDADNWFKFTDAPDWSNGIYGDADASGTSGTIDPASDGNNINIPDAGYYKVNVDLVGFTYTYLNTAWGLIGDAVPPYDWSVDQKLTYDDVNKVWTITLDLVAGEIKFRANDGWDLNYGSDNANGVCNAGGANIPIAAAGNYTITLNLNGPLYRYSITLN